MGANGWETTVEKHADPSLFTKPCPSEGTKSERTFDASPAPNDAEILFELVETTVLEAAEERDLRGACQKTTILSNMHFIAKSHTYIYNNQTWNVN